MAIVPAPRTWGVGDLETAALLNTNIRDPLNYLLGPPRCQVVATSTQSIASGGSGAAITWSSATQNNDGMWLSGTTLTVVTTGSYEITAGVAFAANATGYRYISVLVNGSGVVTAVAPAVSGGTTTAQIPIYETGTLTAGTTITLQAFQNSGAALSTFVTSGNAVWLRAKWVSN